MQRFFIYTDFTRRLNHSCFKCSFVDRMAATRLPVCSIFTCCLRTLTPTALIGGLLPTGFSNLLHIVACIERPSLVVQCCASGVFLRGALAFREYPTVLQWQNSARSVRPSLTDLRLDRVSSFSIASPILQRSSQL